MQYPKIHHLGAIATKAFIDNLKKVVKQQYLLHMSSEYGELRPTSGWDLLASLGHPCTFQRVLRLGSVSVRHCSSGRQPNFAALNSGRHLYSAGRPSRWPLAHILVVAYSNNATNLQRFIAIAVLPILMRLGRYRNLYWHWHWHWYFISHSTPCCPTK